MARLTPAIAQVEKPEPKRDDAVDRVGVVTPLVAPLLVSGMSRSPVEFRAHPVLLVEVVEIPVARAVPDSGLAAGHGQAMWEFDPVHIPVFQYRQCAAFAIAERYLDLTAPAHLLAGIHGQPDPGRGSAPAADGAANPRIRVVEGGCGRDEVKHRIFHPGARREHGGMPAVQDRV